MTKAIAQFGEDHPLPAQLSLTLSGMIRKQDGREEEATHMLVAALRKLLKMRDLQTNLADPNFNMATANYASCTMQLHDTLPDAGILAVFGNAAAAATTAAISPPFFRCHTHITVAEVRARQHQPEAARTAFERAPELLPQIDADKRIAAQEKNAQVEAILPK